MTTLFQKLADPFPPAKVSWRVGQVTKGDATKASALCYIDARDVMDRLDEACGPDGWQDSYTETAKGRLICTIRIKVGDDWIAKSDGAGDTAVEGEKGAISDAFKRCAVKWGIGRYLYDIPIQWVKINNFKQIEPSEKPKLQRALPGSRIADDPDDAPAASPPPPPSQKPTASAQAPKTDGADPHVEEDRKAFAAAKTALKQGKDKEWIEGVMNDPAIDALKARRPDAYATLALLADQQIEAIQIRPTGV